MSSFVKSRTIRTDAGTLELVAATIDQLHGIARYWPMELVRTPDAPGRFGLVFQHGGQEVHGVEMQPADIAEADAIATASKTCNLPLMTVIGMDLRPRLAMGGLAMHFAIEGPRVFVIKDPLQEAEPVWEYVVRVGFPTLPYAPMQPTPLPGAPPAGDARAGNQWPDPLLRQRWLIDETGLGA